MLDMEWDFYEKNCDELVDKYCGKYFENKTNLCDKAIAINKRNK